VKHSAVPVAPAMMRHIGLCVALCLARCETRGLQQGIFDDLLKTDKTSDPIDAYLSSHSLTGSATEQKSASKQAEDYKPWHMPKFTASEPAHIAMPLAANSGEGQVVDIKLDSELQESLLQKGKTGRAMGIFDDLFKKEKSNEDPMDAYINAHPSSSSSDVWVSKEEKPAGKPAEDYKFTADSSGKWHMPKFTAADPVRIAMPLAAGSGEGVVVDIKLDSELQESLLQNGKKGLSATLLSRHHVAAVAAPGCDCSQCRGERKVTDAPTSGFKGFQCKPRAAGSKISSCRQQGDANTWVVQSAKVLTYERFCLYTCKPLIPKAITPNVSCSHFSLSEAKLGQSPSGNGRAFLWHSNPLTDSSTLSSIDTPQVGVADATQNLQKAMAKVN